MELSGQEEGEIAIPINSTTTTTTGTYGGGHHGNGNGHGHGHGHLNTHHHHHDNSPPPSHHSHSHSHSHMMMASSAPQLNHPSSNGQDQQGGYNKKVKVRYRECLKNHAAGMGGNATDGCGEFMPSGEEGSMEALNCSACHCHRNFHRREVEGDLQPPTTSFDYPSSQHYSNSRSNKFLLGGHPHHYHNPNMLLSTAEAHLMGYPTGGSILPSRTVPPPPHQHHQMIMPYSIGPLPSESDDQEEGGGMARPARQGLVNKKRFRTKFTQEQKEKMLAFAEKVGWKIQKQEESVVQHFCQEIGVKRRVLKVWMHNNKHNHLAAAKNNNNNPPTASST